MSDIKKDRGMVEIGLKVMLELTLSDDDTLYVRFWKNSC